MPHSFVYRKKRAATSNLLSTFWPFAHICPVLLRSVFRLPSMMDSGVACASLCLPLCYSLKTPSRSFLHPSSFHNQFPRHIAVLACPLNWQQPHSFLQFFTLVLCCPSLPTNHPGLLQTHLFHVLRDSPHVHRYLSLRHQGLPLLAT